MQEITQSRDKSELEPDASGQGKAGHQSQQRGIINIMEHYSLQRQPIAGRVLDVNTLLEQEAENRKRRAEAAKHLLKKTFMRLLRVISLPLGQYLINFFFLHIFHPLKIPEMKCLSQLFISISEKA